MAVIEIYSNLENRDETDEDHRPPFQQSRKAAFATTVVARPKNVNKYNHILISNLSFNDYKPFLKVVSQLFTKKK